MIITETADENRTTEAAATSTTLLNPDAVSTRPVDTVDNSGTITQTNNNETEGEFQTPKSPATAPREILYTRKPPEFPGTSEVTSEQDVERRSDLFPDPFAVSAALGIIVLLAVTVVVIRRFRKV